MTDSRVWHNRAAYRRLEGAAACAASAARRCFDVPAELPQLLGFRTEPTDVRPRCKQLSTCGFVQL